MPQHIAKDQRKVDIAEAYRLLDSGLSQGAVARQLSCNQSHISRLNKARREAAQTNGHQPTTTLQRVTLDGEPVSAPPAHMDAPMHRSASERVLIGIWEKLDIRVEVLEAFMAAQQSTQRTLSASAHSDALRRTEPVEWVNRGTHLAADMIERIKAYATQHRLEMREVIDLALRRFFAEEDARHGD